MCKWVRVGEGMHQAAWLARSVARLEALVPSETAAKRRVQAPNRARHFHIKLLARRGAAEPPLRCDQLAEA